MRALRIHAFTLIELLITISILAIIVTISIGSYSYARRGIVLDLESDKLIARLNTVRDSSKVSASCKGLRIQRSGVLEELSAPYSYEQRTCGEFKVDRQFTTAPEVLVSKILSNAGDVAATTVNFIPPQGVVSSIPPATIIEVTLGLKAGAPFTKTIIVNTVTGSITKK